MLASKHRLLLVDDSVVARQLMTKALETLPDMEVVGVAADGEQALRSISARPPDLVVLDLEMPGYDGIETLIRLRKRWPRLPVVVFSALSERGAVQTVEALRRGADDYLFKPRGLASPAAALAYVREQLGARIRVLLEREPAIPCVEARAPVPARCAAFELIVIASSTGGPAALAQLLPALPAELDVPILIAQHLLPEFVSGLAARLDASAALRVGAAYDGLQPQPGEVWFAPGGGHMRAVATPTGLRVHVEYGPRVNGCRPSANLLFESAAAASGADVLAIVLTGMGRDGCEGARAIVGAGGSVLVQDEPSSVVWSMPGAVVRAGIEAGVCPLSELAMRIVETLGRAQSRPRMSAHV